MYNVSGPELDEITAEAKEWYVNERIALIKIMTDPYPYGSVPLTPEVQYENYIQNRQNPQSFIQMREALYRIYRGKPNALQLVEDEINKYVVRMEEIGRELNARP